MWRRGTISSKSTGEPAAFERRGANSERRLATKTTPLHPSWREAFSAIGLGLLLTLLVVRPAHAYLDAGSINFVIQSVVVVIVSATLYLRVSWKKVTGKVRSLFTPKGDAGKSGSESS